jgi:hypothetical protein
MGAGEDIKQVIERLRAQLDEDERVARSTIRAKGGWHAVGGWPETGPTDVRDDACRYVVQDADETDVAHIVRWNPARVLVEVEAKRRILDIAANVTEMSHDTAATIVDALVSPLGGTEVHDGAQAGR